MTGLTVRELSYLIRTGRLSNGNPVQPPFDNCAGRQAVGQVQRRGFVSRLEFAAMSRGAAAVDAASFRADQAASADHDVDDPYDR